MAVLVALVAIGALLFAGTLAGSLAIDRRYPPTGHLVEIGEISLHYRDPRPTAGGQGLPVLVVHGASGNGEEASLALDPLLPGRRVIYPDRPGHGHSSRGDDRMAAPLAQAEVLVGLLDRLGIGEVVVVGHSWGAAVAAAMAVEHPGRVAGLVLIAPATHPWPGGVAWYHGVTRMPVVGRLFAWTLPLPVGLATLSGAVEEVFHPDPVPPAYVDEAAIPLVLRPWSFRSNSLDISGLNANLAEMAPRYAGIRAPTVVVTGDRDGVVAPAIHAEALAREIDGAELVRIPDAGHMPHHAHPDVVAAAMARVFERAAAQAADEAAGRVPDQIPD